MAQGGVVSMAETGIIQYKDFLIVLLVAGIAVPLLVRMGLNAILSFLLVGFLISPAVLGRQVHLLPFLKAFVITDEAGLAPMAELGVVFLLFLIGLELSFERLFTLRRLVFGLGGVQVVFTAALVFIGLRLIGVAPAAALVMGAGLSLSSTAIVIQLLSDEKRMSSQTGRVSFSILLLQDLAVIPILLFVTAMGRSAEGPLLASIATALLGALVAVALIVGVGRYLLRPLLRMVASTDSADLFMATVLLIAVGTGVLAHAAGLSMALGAFIAGLTLAETEYRRVIESIIEPFKGLLLGAFFLLVGLNLSLDGLLATPLIIIGSALLIVAVKALVIYASARAFRINHAAALESALLLGPCGEFAFVIFAAAKLAGILDAGLHGQLLLIATITMMAIPWLAKLGRRLARRGGARKAPVAPEALIEPSADAQPRIIVAGFGRVGKLLGTMLAEHNIPYLAIDSDSANAAKERKAGFPVYFGDATDKAFLDKCGLSQATAIAVTMDNPARVDSVVKIARAQRADIKIIARARDERHAMRLYEIGATEAVPETIEASLQLGESLLVEAGIAMGLVIASVHERRDGFRKLLGRPNRRKELERATLRRRKKL
jgi:Kef-type K+ transport system membrane component KefB/voltage-gated potassium channel Kch